MRVTERGWAGHYICANECRFRRNTLLEHKDIKIVVSSVGCQEREEEFVMIGVNRYYETMAFHAKLADNRYHDADVTRIVDFDSDWYISELDADDEANIMHDKVVKEIKSKLIKGGNNE